VADPLQTGGIEIATTGAKALTSDGKGQRQNSKNAATESEEV
jgi:hypothetical protein